MFFITFPPGWRVLWDERHTEGLWGLQIHLKMMRKQSWNKLGWVYFLSKKKFGTKLWISKFQGEKCFFDLYTKLKGVVGLKITLHAFGGSNYIWKCWGIFLKQIETIWFLGQKFFFLKPNFDTSKFRAENPFSLKTETYPHFV